MLICICFCNRVTETAIYPCQSVSNYPKCSGNKTRKLTKAHRTLRRFDSQQKMQHHYVPWKHHNKGHRDARQCSTPRRNSTLLNPGAAKLGENTVYVRQFRHRWTYGLWLTETLVEKMIGRAELRRERKRRGQDSLSLSRYKVNSVCVLLDFIRQQKEPCMLPDTTLTLVSLCIKVKWAKSPV